MCDALLFVLAPQVPVDASAGSERGSGEILHNLSDEPRNFCGSLRHSQWV